MKDPRTAAGRALWGKGESHQATCPDPFVCCVRDEDILAIEDEAIKAEKDRLRTVLLSALGDNEPRQELVNLVWVLELLEP